MACIMVVEDDKALQDLLQLVLSRRGHEVLLSPNGIDALYQISQLKPDLILLDLMMPWASGDAVLGYIRSTEALKHTRVLVISAHPNGATLADQLDADGFLAKPVDMGALAAMVERVLAKERHPS